MWCLGGKLAKYAWKTPSILNISSHQDSGWWFITLLVARPTKSVIYFVLAFQYQVLFMVSINAHAVSLSLHLVSDAFFFFSACHTELSLFTLWYFRDTPLVIFISMRKVYKLQMRSCLLLVLIAVIVGEILYAGYTYRTEMPLLMSLRSERLPFSVFLT